MKSVQTANFYVKLIVTKISLIKKHGVGRHPPKWCVYHGFSHLGFIDCDKHICAGCSMQNTDEIKVEESKACTTAVGNVISRFSMSDVCINTGRANLAFGRILINCC